MFPLWFQSAIVMTLTSYLLSVLITLRRRNRRSWKDLVALIDAGPETLVLPQDPAAASILEEVVWPPLQDLTSLQTRFQNARAVLEMADYLDRNASPGSAGPDLATIRRKALEIRLEAFLSLPRYAFSTPAAEPDEA